MLCGYCHSTFVNGWAERWPDGLSAPVAQASSNAAPWLLTACPLSQRTLLGAILS